MKNSPTNLKFGKFYLKFALLCSTSRYLPYVRGEVAFCPTVRYTVQNATADISCLLWFLYVTKGQNVNVPTLTTYVLVQYMETGSFWAKEKLITKF